MGKMFTVLLGIPEVQAYYDERMKLIDDGKLTGDDLRTFKKFLKVICLLEDNPKHPGLKSHKIDALSSKEVTIFESYLENNTPAAGRVFWQYGPDPATITILSIQPHPNSKSGAYARIQLSSPPKK